MTFGQVTGVAPGLLQQQRQATAAAGAPATGIAGQQVDMALPLLDGSEKGRADPAFQAHSGPIGSWAKAIWNMWIPYDLMQESVADAMIRIARASRMWAVVKGPAAALVATATRIGWTVIDAHTVIADTGRIVDLSIEPPIVVTALCDEAVVRWRWKRIEERIPELRSATPGTGAVMAPI